jgi:hypothetical protein
MEESFFMKADLLHKQRCAHSCEATMQWCRTSQFPPSAVPSTVSGHYRIGATGRSQLPPQGLVN